MAARGPTTVWSLQSARGARLVGLFLLVGFGGLPCLGGGFPLSLSKLRLLQPTGGEVLFAELLLVFQRGLGTAVAVGVLSYLPPFPAHSQ